MLDEQELITVTVEKVNPQLPGRIFFFSDC